MLFFGGISLCAVAQTKEEILDKQILEYWECFKKLSKPAPHDQVITLSNGKQIGLLSQTDFARSAFVSVDQLLKDMQLWYNSTYLWQSRQKKSTTTLMDTHEISEWELNSLGEISDEYFKSGDNTYHVVAHGLVNSNGISAGSISMGGQTLDAKETAELILLQMEEKYQIMLNTRKQPFVVVLHSCNSAQGENSFAKQLSEELAKQIDNVAVVGAPDAVYAEMDENGKYTEMVSSVRAIKQNKPERKNWLVFQNGKQAMQGTPDYKSTVKNYLEKAK